MKTKGFTLIEILIVIAILGILTLLISGNFITSLKKGRDARRKTDLEQIQRALEMYYEDKKAYPTPAGSYGLPFGGQLIDSVTGKIYMQKLPQDPLTSNSYNYQSDGTYYKLYSCLENKLDLGPGVKVVGETQSDYGLPCGACGNCNYGISSSNLAL
ncbi:MAG: prepilin-type N-terminal cleavage/methylation domain-containing protein [Microgenomates group bacterium]|nr:prepilin-type N-terminal cleavage/methylation domain-containing protein [Microgenomates group bacterium]